MIKNIVGERHGRLVVLCPTEKRSGGHVIWKCRCDCGKVTFVYSDKLNSGKTKSCGCFHRDLAREQGWKNFKHGDARDERTADNKTRSRLYTTWSSMKRRCANFADSAFVYYGGKGISVCDEWKDNYLAFKFWAILNNYDDTLIIHRINNDGNYEPTNCRWLTKSEHDKMKGA